MISVNYHTHSTYCDGKNSPEEIVLAACSQGIKVLGFSGHSPLPNENWTMTEEGLEKYREEILFLKEKYKDKLEILLGLEQDILSKPPKGEYDFIIGAVHGIETPDGILYMDSTADILKAGIKKHFENDPMIVAERYFELVRELCEKTKADIIAHLDLLTKFDEKESAPLFDSKNPRYINAAKKAIEKLSKSEKKPLFEINTGAMARGYRTTPYPSKELLRIIRDCGCDVIINSDCHDMRMLTHGFDKALELAKECGFTRIARLSEGEVKFESI